MSEPQYNPAHVMAYLDMLPEIIEGLERTLTLPLEIHRLDQIEAMLGTALFELELVELGVLE